MLWDNKSGLDEFNKIKFTKHDLTKDWAQITYLAVSHSDHYIRMFSVLVWGCIWILFMHRWFCLIHLIRWKSLHFERKNRIASQCFIPALSGHLPHQHKNNFPLTLNSSSFSQIFCALASGILAILHWNCSICLLYSNTICNFWEYINYIMVVKIIMVPIVPMPMYKKYPLAILNFPEI